MSLSASRTSTSLEILREQGPMTLRDLTRATARRRNWSLMYADVDAVMHGHLERGQVTREKADDWRNDVWTAVPSPEAQQHASGGPS